MILSRSKDLLHSTKKWLWPLWAFAFITPFTPWLDLSIERYFFRYGNDSVEHFMAHPFLDFLFAYGTVPANFTASIAAFLLIASYIFLSLKPYRNAFLVLLLTLAIGAGLITNSLLKEHWGRPRPKQVEEFGGIQQFRPFYHPNFFHQPQPSKSFPCGHCAMGFYFFALALVGARYKSQFLWYLGWILAILLGVTLSLLRMAQGGHFLSDTLFAALLMWYTALAVDWLVYSGEEFP